jgi:hypothetical protein
LQQKSRDEDLKGVIFQALLDKYIMASLKEPRLEVKLEKDRVMLLNLIRAIQLASKLETILLGGGNLPLDEVIKQGFENQHLGSSRASLWLETCSLTIQLSWDFSNPTGHCFISKCQYRILVRFVTLVTQPSAVWLWLWTMIVVVVQIAHFARFVSFVGRQKTLVRLDLFGDQKINWMNWWH